MTVDSEELRVKFEKFVCERFITGSIDQERRDDIAEMAQEIAEELLNDGGLKKTAIFKQFRMPENDEVMSFDLNGDALSCFGDTSWYRYNKSGIKIGYHFTAIRGNDVPYNTDPQATSLAMLEKLMLHAIWPGKDPTQREYTDKSLSQMHASIRTVLSWLYWQGYFLSSSTENVPHDNELITAEVVRSELVLRTSEDSLISHLQTFLIGIRLWVRFSTTKWCPEWFRPTFAYRDIVDRCIAKVIADSIARKRNRWEAIDFDSLMQLFFTAQNYLELYTLDIFWLLERFEAAYDLSASVSTPFPQLDITSNGRTSKIYYEICGRDYAINPQTGQPWFSPEISSVSRGKDRDGNPYGYEVKLTPFVRQVRCLVGAATFILFSFTGMRHWDMKAMKTGALLIDGKNLDETGNIFAQIDAGTTFDLSRTVFKMKPSPSGEQHMTPIPKIAAKAYAVLLKVFSYSRMSVDPETEGTSVTSISDFLFPANGLKFKWHEVGYGFTSENPHMTTIHGFLKKFCDAADVDYFFPHQCRKTLATLLINHDPECLEVIRWLLGHNSIKMTYEYIMSLPLIRDEVLQHLRETNAKNLVEFVSDTLTGHVAGAAGNRALDSVVKNHEFWKGQKLEYSIYVLIKTYDDANFALVRTPAAWCVRFPSRVPQTAPCLPLAIQEAIKNGEATDIILPRFEHCVPWECGNAGHSRGDLATARRSHRYASNMAANSSGKIRAQYQLQADYWETVVHQLEFGRYDVTNAFLLSRWANSSFAGSV